VALARLAANLTRQAKWEAAEPPLRECIAIQELVEADSWGTFATRSALGGVLAQQREFAEAEPLLVQGYEGMKQREDQIPADQKLQLIEALDRLTRFYAAMENPVEAANWQQELEATRQRLAEVAK
jgi:hypothetical protein